MSKKPVLFISPLPPPHGGIATWTKKILAHGLPDQTPVTLVNTRILGSRNIFDGVFLSLAEVYRTLRIYFALCYQLLTNRPKLIHLCCSLSALGVFRDVVCVSLAKLFRVPVVIHYHGNVQDFNGARFRGISAKALLYLLRRADMNIVANQPSLLTTQQLLPGSQHKIILLPNFIEESIFQLEKKPVAPHQRLRAIYAGGITQAKGCAEILTMANEFPAIDFHLFGKMHADMAEIYKASPGNVKLHGEVAQAILLQQMGESDFLLFPSYSEGFPLTVLEAMAMGLPVISTHVGGIPEMICDGAGGFLVNPRDTTALADAIRKLATAPALLTRMGAYNKQKSYQQYRYSIVMARLMDIYNQILPAGANKCVA